VASIFAGHRVKSTKIRFANFYIQRLRIMRKITEMSANLPKLSKTWNSSLWQRNALWNLIQ